MATLQREAQAAGNSFPLGNRADRAADKESGNMIDGPRSFSLDFGSLFTRGEEVDSPGSGDREK